VLVLDRATDLAAPLLHELTYQAMCHDLLDVTASGVVRRVVRTVVVARSAAQSRGGGGSRSTAVHGLGRAAAFSLLLAPCSLLLAPPTRRPSVL
jgi:2-methylcitrate dehydratase PrpD